MSLKKILTVTSSPVVVWNVWVSPDGMAVSCGVPTQKQRSLYWGDLRQEDIFISSSERNSFSVMDSLSWTSLPLSLP